MKNLLLFTCCLCMLHFGASAQTQDNNDGSLGLPGDNLNLYAVMNLFQESRSLPQFEKSLNDENSKINNLDLNGDGQIDYISVVDKVDGRLHTIVLKDAISATETQDVAVFYVNKDANNQVQIQLIGDEALYGKDYIIEPNPDGNASANQGNLDNGETVVAAPSAWPIIGALFLRSYIAWHSPWYYGYYPNYWSPWHPLFWHSYYGYHSNLNYFYEGNYRHTNYYRDDHFRDRYYGGRRSFSSSVIRRNNEGYYRSTYSHPELRREGSDRFNKMHPGNMNRSGNNRPGIQQHNANQPSRGVGNRPSSGSGVIRQATRIMNDRSPANSNNSRPDARRANEGARPAMNQHNDNRPNRPSGNSNLNRSVINRSNAQPSNNRNNAQPANNRAAQPSNNRSAQPENNQGQRQQGNSPSARPAAQPSNNQGQRQQGNSPSARPSARPAAQPAARPAAQPSARPAAKSDTRPAAAKERKPANDKEAR